MGKRAVPTADRSWIQPRDARKYSLSRHDGPRKKKCHQDPSKAFSTAATLRNHRARVGVRNWGGETMQGGLEFLAIVPGVYPEDREIFGL